MYVYLQREDRIKKEKNDKISNTNRQENQNCLYYKKKRRIGYQKGRWKD